MKLLREVLAGVRRLDKQQDQEDEFDLPEDDEFEGEEPPQDEMSLDSDEDDIDLDSDDSGDDQFSQDSEEDIDLDSETDDELDSVASQATEDPNRQGLIRTVKNAHLVYKREVEEGTFEELWVYNISSLRGELDVRKAIIAGTDIPVNKTSSPDGSQSYEVWSVGNAEMIVIRGLPN